MPEGSFSLRELQAAGEVKPSDLEALTAGDGVTLSYRRYAPASPRAALLFYHGGGAHSGAGYQHLGSGLQRRYGTVVYTPDLRGHGASGGPRGDAPGPEQVWADITTFITHIRAEWPQLPVVLGGHSSGAGLGWSGGRTAEIGPAGGIAVAPGHAGPHPGPCGIRALGRGLPGLDPGRAAPCKQALRTTSCFPRSSRG